MEIETNISIEIDEDDWCAEIDLDNRIANGMEDFVIEAVKTAVEDQTYDLREHLRRVDVGTITEDRVREIVRNEITKSINGVGSVLAAMIGPKENSND